jgi:hypothetical protein
MQGQVAGAEAQRRAKVQKENTPKIAKLIQQQLENKMVVLFKKHAEYEKTGQEPPYKDLETEMEKMISSTIASSIKVDPSDKKVFDNRLDELTSEIKKDLDGFKNSEVVRNIITDIITRSFSTKKSYSIDNAGEKSLDIVLALLKKGIDINKIVEAITKQFGKETIFGDNDQDKKDTIEKIAKMQKAGASREKILQALTKEDDVNAADDSKEEQFPGQEFAGDQAFYRRFYDNLKEFMFRKTHEDLDLYDPDSVAKFVEHNIDEHKAELGIKSKEQAEKIVDAILRDPDMVFNFEPQKDFRGLAWSRKGLRYTKDAAHGENVAYVQDENDKWSEWEIFPNSSWRVYKQVANSSQVKSLENLKSEMIPRQFRQDVTGGQTNLYRVTTR